jgi:hypothetical protein
MVKRWRIASMHSIEVIRDTARHQILSLLSTYRNGRAERN